MYKEILRTMNTEAFMASLALIVFFVFFVLVLIEAWRKSKEEVYHLERLPLEEDDAASEAGIHPTT
jgi:cbb3-type cytochrome oxidase subunit 3